MPGNCTAASAPHTHAMLLRRHVVGAGYHERLWLWAALPLVPLRCVPLLLVEVPRPLLLVLLLLQSPGSCCAVPRDSREGGAWPARACC